VASEKAYKSLEDFCRLFVDEGIYEKVLSAEGGEDK